MENNVANTTTLAANADTFASATDPNLTFTVPSKTKSSTEDQYHMKIQTFELEYELELRFRGSNKLPPEIICLNTPFELFSYWFTEDIINLIRDQTNLYSVQGDANKPVNVTAQEIRQIR